MKTIVQERRRFPRTDSPPQVAINLLSPNASALVSRVNYSEGGLCLRVQEALEVRSLVRLQWTPGRPPGPPVARAGAGSVEKSDRAVEFTGRVAWVIQRLDLRGGPPFLYDVGIEFVDAPPMLRQLVARAGTRLATSKDGGVTHKALSPAVIHGRRFIPQLEREFSRPSRWHLVVSIDSVPCFSQRFPSERAAVAAWARFKRQQARR